jgi:hypothetical protein
MHIRLRVRLPHLWLSPSRALSPPSDTSARMRAVLHAHGAINQSQIIIDRYKVDHSPDQVIQRAQIAAIAGWGPSCRQRPTWLQGRNSPIAEPRAQAPRPQIDPKYNAPSASSDFRGAKSNVPNAPGSPHAHQRRPASPNQRRCTPRTEAATDARTNGYALAIYGYRRQTLRCVPRPSPPTIFALTDRGGLHLMSAKPYRPETLAACRTQSPG